MASYADHRTEPRLLVLLAIGTAALLACVGAALASGVFRVTQVSFPLAPGFAPLVRTQVRLADGPRFEVWSQASGLSYSLWYPFEERSAAGETLACRVEVEGWLRTGTRHRNLLDTRCTCELPRLHHDRETACPGVP